MKNQSEGCILFFVKYPFPGQVKTRLAMEIGAENAAELYKCFVLDMLGDIERTCMDVAICYHPSYQQCRISEWLGTENRYFPQLGDDIGERMKNAFVQCFQHKYEKAVLIGSDCPDMPGEYIKQGLHALDSNDAVIGPSGDGGYYLIGFKRKALKTRVFDGISWSSDKVYTQTIEILNSLKTKPYILPQWYDVDTLSDLQLLLDRSKGTAFEESRTYFYLRANKLRSGSNV